MNNDDDNIPLQWGKSPCGHSARFAYTEDGGKVIVCLLCEREALRKYGTFGHLRTCNVNNQDEWDAAQLALNDTPTYDRDEGWSVAVAEIAQRRAECTCGFAKVQEVIVQDLDKAAAAVQP